MSYESFQPAEVSPELQANIEKHGLEPSPDYAFGKTIVETLTHFSQESDPTNPDPPALFVGGYCRDLCLGLDPYDLDIATALPAETVVQLLRAQGITANLIQAVQAYPIVIAQNDQTTIEVATFRQDVYQNSGSRHPDTTKPATLEDDALRRDFTINALYLNPLTRQLIDPTTQGIPDLNNHLIRFVGDPRQRINEDQLRLLRAIRFKNRLNFAYTSNTESAIKDLAAEVTRLSPERLRDELTKILLHPTRANALRDLDQLGLLSQLLPAFTAGHGVEQSPDHHNEGDVFAHQLLVMASLPEDISPILAWGALLHDIGKPGTHQQDPATGKITFYGHDRLGADLARRHILGQSGLGFPADQTDAIVWLINQHMRIRNLPDMGRQKQLEVIKHPYFSDLLALLWADNAASLRPDNTIDQQSYHDAQAVADHYQYLQEIPTIKKSFGFDGPFFIQRYAIDPGHQKRLGPLTAYLNNLYQNGQASTSDQVLTAADRWWRQQPN